MSNTKTETEAALCPAAYVTLLNKGLERVVEVSKTSLDLLVAQNAEILAACKKSIDASFPAHSLFDLAGQVFAGQIALQKNVLDFLIEQNAALAEAAKSYVHDAGTAKAEIAALLQQSVDQAVSVQNSALDLAAQQVKAVSETVQNQPEVSGKPVEKVAGSVQRSFETVVSAQKQILTSAAKATKSPAPKSQTKR
jgi:hypothetical protein